MNYTYMIQSDNNPDYFVKFGENGFIKFVLQPEATLFTSYGKALDMIIQYNIPGVTIYRTI